MAIMALITQHAMLLLAEEKLARHLLSLLFTFNGLVRLSAT